MSENREVFTEEINGLNHRIYGLERDIGELTSENTELRVKVGRLNKLAVSLCRFGSD